VLRQQASDAINRGPRFAAGVVDILNDFDAARKCVAARRH
jgi:hypothetical protein